MNWKIVLLIALVLGIGIRFWDNPEVDDYFKDWGGDIFLHGYDAYYYHGCVEKDCNTSDMYLSLLKDISFIGKTSKLMIWFNFGLFILLLLLVFLLAMVVTGDPVVAALSVLFLGINNVLYYRSFIGWVDSDLMILVLNTILVFFILLVFDMMWERKFKEMWFLLFLYILVAVVYQSVWDGHIYIHLIMLPLFVISYIFSNIDVKRIPLIIIPLFVVIGIVLVLNGNLLKRALIVDDITDENAVSQSIPKYLFGIDTFWIFIVILLSGLFLVWANGKELFIYVWFYMLLMLGYFNHRIIYHLVVPYVILKSRIINEYGKRYLKTAYVPILTILVIITLATASYSKPNPIMNKDILRLTDYLNENTTVYGNVSDVPHWWHVFSYWDNGVFYGAYTNASIMCIHDSGWAKSVADYLVSSNESVYGSYVPYLFILSYNEFTKVDELERISDHKLTSDSMIFRLREGRDLINHTLIYSNDYVMLFNVT